MMPREPEPEYMDLPEEAEAYAVADFDEVNAAFVERLLEVAGNGAGARVLDLGTGPADMPRRVSLARPGWVVCGLDASRAMLAWGLEALRAEGVSVGLVQADARACPFADGVFEGVFSNSILHHVADPIAFWREVKRLVGPGGSVFLRDLLRPASREEARHLTQEYAAGESALLQEEFHRSLLAAYTVAEVRAQLAEVGLAELKVAQVSDRHLDAFGSI
jgi:ubiquinone/menaquinone biosynthesis C-methylase UbiE